MTDTATPADRPAAPDPEAHTPEGAGPVVPRPIVLGIETSCDETAVALVDGARRVLAHKLVSQIEDHAAYGGVVPEIAARAHIEHLDRLVKAALDDVGLALGDVDAVAATAGPGLIGGVMVGLVTAKALALAAGKPLVAVNHLEAHALSPRLTEPDLDFPYLLLLVSGGHCQILVVEGVGRYRRLGSTIDDAVGEAFDKTAKLMGLGYPGGPAVERLAAAGDPTRFDLPRPFVGDRSLNFSFSGLKSALRRQGERLLAEQGGLSDADKADLCAAFQAAVADCLADRVARALDRGPAGAALVVAGGVAANQALRARLAQVAADAGRTFQAPPLWLCTDNGAMVAWAGVERFRLGFTDPLDVPARPRWPLDEAGAPVYGSGRKGAKA
ncbi:O-sialoglycoprotein endopeptidase [Rhodothalassium salexigens DSM 2132]|uniref:tRNA N6-adenosine threonylcarbamoyltransferase n=1 Tax=Rhodothalassium salexigens DSM 2132 TaxID=1188247 RepID=A0A4R2PI93_RHOSA|nr:tRNA (adenosine(37)-N6)-threonylcarbamoyltransferase complex transferase subunit TsaD [Rhodothalassium salexigens]MBB4211261.1 N6-L-threonylcarbamoyladenine synthase [Rhodothalassium salexigens DSM 2132]MBK1639355.1 tRNA (adenosine(37)-N6)-threonylcarbamoyltransferase complex transferase subunit TsaD [Rhodothalassium salexigens DSM 2132]TCP35183.1 O-sialoglycoprotein endopeptidase [Rhodothalassium salexigens DSM 2132]